MIIVAVLIVIIIFVFAFIRQPQFGKLPAGERLERIKLSSQYKNGAFQNQSITPQLTGDATYYKVFKQFFFGKSKTVTPPAILPSKKHNLKQLNINEDLLVWFGHSSYFLQLNGKRFLVDPVLSGNASPISTAAKSFKGSDVYAVEDFPPIDYLIITHDHYDHLDYKTLKKLKPLVGKVITTLGVGSHLEYWGYEEDKIIELDWNEQVILDNGFIINSAPARHFSGRKFKRNQTLWMSLILTTPGHKLYIGGDSGYDSHFAKIGAEFGPFDLAILENGQYNKYWQYIHMMPEEVVQAAIDLKAKKLLPVHWAKFALGLHDWDDPIKRVLNESKLKHMPLIHPMIGEIVNLNENKSFSNWWEEMK